MEKREKWSQLNQLLGRRIRTLRAEQGLSLAQLAYESDPQLTRHHLSQIETGKKWPSMKVILGLAERLGVEAFELFLVNGSDRQVIAEMVRRLPDARRQDLRRALQKELAPEGS